MRQPSVKRVMLVQRRLGSDPGGRPVRRYSLARVGPTTVSALGVDRLERMEKIARMDAAEKTARELRDRPFGDSARPPAS